MEGGRDRSRLIVGVAAAALALLALIGIWIAAPAIERDLETRAAAALAAAGISDAAVTADGRALTLTGPARDDAATGAALAAAAVFGVRRVEAAFGAPVPNAANGYRFQADWDGAALTLAGFMPGLDDRESVVAYGRDVFPGAPIAADALRVAPHPPAERWSDAAKGGLKVLKALARGRLTIEGVTVTLSGIAPDEAARAAATDLLAGLPEPFTMLADIDVGAAAPPVATKTAYRFGAAFDGQRLALSGALPSAAAREAIKAALAKARPGLALDDKTALDPAAPDGAFADAVAALIVPFVQRAESGLLTFEGRAVTLAAVTRNAEGVKALTAALRDIPAAYDWTAELNVAGAAPAAAIASDPANPARACQSAFSEALAAAPILFASASAALPDSAEPLVANLAGIAATCPEARLEIAGHTDASGNPARNVKLSEDRAAALEAALIVKGVDAARLTAKGYGAARPVAPNDTDANKALNRRIEVIVRP